MSNTTENKLLWMIWENLQELSDKSNSKFIKELLGLFARILRWEIDNTVKESQSNIDKVATDLISDKLNTTDENISRPEQEILGKLIELEGSDGKIENWLTWLEENNNGELPLWVVEEEHSVMHLFAKESDDEWNKKEIDLNENEFNEVAEFIGKKLKVCDDVFQLAQSNNEKVKDLLDKYKTKEEIVDSCNRVLEKNEWNIDLVTVDLIIEDLNEKQREETETSQNLAA